MYRRFWICLSFLFLFTLPVAFHGLAQNMDTVSIETIPVTENIYMLQGQGGNIGVLSGEDGVLLIDDQFAELTDKIRAAVAEISENDIRFVINTHWHGDHVGGNENLGTAGAIIVAHENVRQRMRDGDFIRFLNRKVAPAPSEALPVITFTENIQLHQNGETIEVFHVEPAHTDGDAVIYFKNANVIHTGDVFFSNIYPFIDTSSNGSVEGVIKAVKKLLEISDGQTRFLPGHGPLASRSDLEEYLEMLETLRDRVASLIAEGKTLEAVQAAKPSSDFDAKWGGGFLSPDKFIQILYEDLSSTKSQNP